MVGSPQPKSLSYMLNRSTDIYGDSKAPTPSTNGHANNVAKKKTRTVIHLSLSDSIPAYGPIADIAFSLARNGVCWNDFQT